MHEYDFVLEAFKSSRGGLSSDHLAEELRALQPSVKKLRKDYNANWRSVQPDYSGTLADAYLLAYVPTYIRQSKYIYRLAKIEDLSLKKVGVFCGGPCPEIIGLLDYLSDNPHFGNIEFYLFEKNLRGWRDVCEGVLKTAREKFGKDRFSFHPESFNLLKQKEVEKHESVISSLDVAIFQNFDNEMGYSVAEKNVMLENILNVADLLPSGSKLLISDLASSRESHTELKIRLGEKFSSTLVPITYSSPNLNRLLQAHLLDGSDGLIPRKTTKISSLVAVKKQPPPPPPPLSSSSSGAGRQSKNFSSKRAEMSKDRVLQSRPSRLFQRGDVVEGLVVKELPNGRGVLLEVEGKEVTISSDDLEIKHPLPTRIYVGRKLTAVITLEDEPCKASRAKYLSKQIQSIRRKIQSSKNVIGVFVGSKPDGSLDVIVEGLPGIVPQSEVEGLEDSLKFDKVVGDTMPLVVLSNPAAGNNLMYSRKRAISRSEQ